MSPWPLRRRPPRNCAFRSCLVVASLNRVSCGQYYHKAHMFLGADPSQATIGRSRASLKMPWKMIWFERIRHH